MAKKEALDAVKDERPFAAVHILATAMLCAAGSSTYELELARLLLERDPKGIEPRERESVAGAFNRHMDAAIDSVNDSIGEPTRAGRRARLAIDLSRAGLVLIDRRELVLLLDRGDPARPTIEECEDLGAELLDGETGYGRVPDLRSDRPSLDEVMIAVDAMPSSSGGIVGLEFQTGVQFLTHSPSFDVAATGSSSGAVGCTDPRVND